MNVFEIQTWLRVGRTDIAVDGDAGLATHAAIDETLWDHGIKGYADPLIAFEQFVMKLIGGLAVGPIDGKLGPILEKARQHWLRGPWRNAVMKAHPGDERMPATLHKWPTYEQLTAYYGEPGTNLVTVSMPFPLRLAWDMNKTVSKVQCHKLVADSLVRVQQSILKSYGYAAVKELRMDVWGGCYAARPMRGSTKLSTHAWGIAWDTDPLHNALRWDKTKASLARPEYKQFWAAWTNEGWLSLGKARDFDWMHTQACRLG